MQNLEEETFCLQNTRKIQNVLHRQKWRLQKDVRVNLNNEHKENLVQLHERLEVLVDKTKSN